MKKLINRFLIRKGGRKKMVKLFSSGQKKQNKTLSNQNQFQQKYPSGMKGKLRHFLKIEN